MSTTFTKNVTLTGVRAFNYAGVAISSAVWGEWNDASNTRLGFAGVRATSTIRHAYVYRFETPTWGGNIESITLSFPLLEELGRDRTIRWSLTSTDPTNSKDYCNQDLPTDSGRLDDGTITVTASTEQWYTVTVDVASLTQSGVYYLVLSPYTTASGSSNYATVNMQSSWANVFAGYITYEADASSANVPDGNLGTAMTISLSADGLAKTLTYSFGSASGTIGTTSGSSISWTPPLSLASEIPTATSGTVTVTCTTEAGETTATATLYVPDDIKPTITSKSMARVNSNSTVEAWAIYLQNYSQIRVGFLATAQYTTISEWKIELGQQTYKGENLSDATVRVSQLSSVLTQAGTFTCKVTVTDARGRVTTTNIANYTVQAYSDPTVTGAAIHRCTAAGVEDSDGTYLYAIGTRSYTQIGTNTCTMYFQYKEKSAENYTSVQMSDNTAVIVGNGQIDVLKSYTTRIYVEDSLTGAYWYEGISTQAVAFNLKPSANSGAAFGGYATDDKVLDLVNGWRLRVESTDKIVVWNTEGTQEITLTTLLENGGGSGGTTDYNALSNRPSIAGVTLSGEKAMSAFGLVTALSSSSTDLQFPSAKCVYDLLGDIETLLAAL